MSANDSTIDNKETAASNNTTEAESLEVSDSTDSTLQEQSSLVSEQEENGGLPVNSDDEWDTDLEREDRHEEYDATGKAVYLSCCKSLDITPVSYFMRHIKDQKINLRHRGLGPTGVKAMAIALVLNTSVTSLDLHDNALGGDGGLYIADMLKENCFVSELDISSNNLASKGCQAICEMLQSNTNLLKLSLSDNKLSDKESHFIATAMRGNDKLLWMDLSYNSFSESSGEHLGLGIVSNDSLEYLNLSWNNIRKKAAILISNGIRSNCTLKTINLSYNGFADDGAVALGEAIKFNNTLIELDISNNRITNLGAMCLAKGLESNNTLETLKIGYNPIQSDGLLAIINASIAYCDSALTTLSCQDIYLDKQFDSLLHEVKKAKPDFNVIPSPRAGGRDPLKALQRHIEEDRDKWLELFADYISDTNTVTRQTFIHAISKTGLNLEHDEMSRILTQLDPTRLGMLSYRHTRLGFEPLVQKTPDTTQ